MKWEIHLRQLLLFALLGCPSVALPASPPATQPELLLVYWSSRDCTWCAAWENPKSGMEKGLKASSEFKKITYRIIKSDRLVDPYVDEDYPPDVKWLKDRVDRGEESPAGRPSWAFYVNKTHIVSFYGVKAWETTNFPAIKKLVAQYSTGDRIVTPSSATSSGPRF
jgi:hypothetical protein